MYAKKSLGQNFIHDKNFIKKLSDLIITDLDSFILEVGPGHGALTNELLKKEYKKFIAIEKDDDLINELKNFENKNKNFELIHGDALEIDYTKLFKNNTVITGNLPFNISSQLLIKWLFNNDWPPFYNKMYLMFQKEVGERIIASSGSKKYGRISVIAQSRCEIKKLLTADSSIFSPKPKVDGVVLEFVPHMKYENIDITLLEKIVKKSFSQRRKKIKSNLKGFESALEKNNIDINLRAEDLTVLDYCNITTTSKKLLTN